MTDLAHRLRRLRWQVRAPSVDAAMGMRTMLRTLMPDVEAALAQAFEAHGMGGQAVHYLERLELTLRLPPKASPHALMQELGSALGRALQHAAAEIQAPPLGLMPGGAAGEAPTGLTQIGERGALLCALLRLRQHAPQRLQQGLQMAWDARQHGWSHLQLDGQIWRVSEAALAHWLQGAVGSPSVQGLADAQAAASRLAAQGYPAPPAPPALNDGLAPAHLPIAEVAAVPDQTDLTDVADVADTADAQAAANPGPPSLSTLQHGQAQLMHYLRTGQIDWTLAGLPADQARQQLREAASNWVDLGMWPDAWPGDAPLPERVGALCRWLSLLSAPQRQAVMARHGQRHHASGLPSGAHGGELAWAASVQFSLKALMQRFASSPSDHVHALALWLDWQHADGALMPEPALRHWVNASRQWMASLAQQGPVDDAWLHCRAQMVQPQQPGSMGDEGGASHSMASAMAVPSAPASATTAPERARAAHALAGAAREPRVSQGHVVAQAGLVLLHPYLSRCFNVLGLYPAGQRGPISDALWPRAASVLHWLAMGDADTPLECDLGLIKPLLGRSEHDALSHGLPALLPQEREEAAALLQAVLGHWPALKGTSVEGLRQSFLQRPGWIEPLDRAWQLRVQPAAFDVLLGSLPWGLSMVKLPWMDRPMHVEWSAP